VDCGENIKLEDIKGEIKEEVNVEDPLSFHQEAKSSNICEDIKEEVKDEESVEVPSSNHHELGNVWLARLDNASFSIVEKIE
jgi:hypothetical protein